MTPDAESTKSAAIHITTAAEFHRHILDAEMPCLADFYSDRCGPCRMLAPTIDALAKKYSGRVAVCKVSLDAAPELAQERNIRGIPAVLFFDGGREVERLVGMQPQSAYEGVLEELIAKRKQAAKENAHANL
jgi:thioredoxin 1